MINDDTITRTKYQAILAKYVTKKCRCSGWVVEQVIDEKIGDIIVNGERCDECRGWIGQPEIEIAAT